MRVWVLLCLSVALILAIEPRPSDGVAPPAVKQVFHRFATRKAAKEAAQRASKGVKPVHHGAHKPGYSPHYHHTGKNGKASDYTIKRMAGSPNEYRVHEHFQYPKKG